MRHTSLHVINPKLRQSTHRKFSSSGFACRYAGGARNTISCKFSQIPVIVCVSMSECNAWRLRLAVTEAGLYCSLFTGAHTA